MAKDLYVDGKFMIWAPKHSDVSLRASYTYAELQAECKGKKGGVELLDAILSAAPHVYVSGNEVAIWDENQQSHWCEHESALTNIYMSIDTNKYSDMTEDDHKRMDLEFSEFMTQYNEKKYEHAVLRIGKLCGGNWKKKIADICSVLGVPLDDENDIAPRDAIKAVKREIAALEEDNSDPKSLNAIVKAEFVQWLVAKDSIEYTKWAEKFEYPVVDVEYG